MKATAAFLFLSTLGRLLLFGMCFVFAGPYTYLASTNSENKNYHINLQ